MKSGYTVPCVYALLPNKRKESYVQLFRQVKSWLDVAARQWSFESLLSDYEQGAYNAVLDVFPGMLLQTLNPWQQPSSMMNCHFSATLNQLGSASQPAAEHFPYVLTPHVECT